MVVHLIHIDLSNDVDRADELVFNIPSEIAAIEKLKVTKFQERTDAIGVIAEVLSKTVSPGANTTRLPTLASR